MSDKTISVSRILTILRGLSEELPSGPPYYPKENWENTIDGLKIFARNTSLDNNMNLSELDITIHLPDLPDSPGLPSPVPPPTPGGDPIEPLKSIASAIGSAENILNDDNLVISQAAVEVNMSVNVPGIAGANTTIKFGVEPRSI